MNNKVNSFTENVSNLIDTVNKSLSILTAVNKSTTTEEDTVIVDVDIQDPITGDPSIVSYSMPSFSKVLYEVDALKKTMEAFTNGEGVILLKDGTYRKISTQPIAISPNNIQNISNPTTFNTKNNWFFESMMFPQLVISIDLKGKIDDRSDRVYIKRLIFDNYDTEETQWFIDNISTKTLTYYEIINILNENGKRYWEDQELYNLTLSSKPYRGYFRINDKAIINGKEWFYLDTMNYGETGDEPLIRNYQLAVGNLLRYNNSMWKIQEINISENRIHIIPMVGLDYPTISHSFEIYISPFTNKILDIAIGYNECNSIFIKGVNDDFNILGDEWSPAMSFWTNNLRLEGSNILLNDYYNEYVADFGKQLEGQAKEKFIPAYFGEKPNAPVFTAENFSVKQINTQLNSTLDTNNIKNTQAQIESVKTLINSLKSTLAQQKSQLVELTDQSQREDLSNKISANTIDLSKKTIEYQSLVRSLSTIAYENSAVLTDPKYRIRGFFAIPDKVGDPAQEIVQFEYAYRYLKLDNSGTSLETFEYIDPSTNQKIKGTFTDWVTVSSAIKQKRYDEATDTYIWVEDSITDGDINNINQVDIPITKGEKVQIKIRSISEAGWPLNPLKSEWSQPVIIEFPSNVATSNQIKNILEDSISEEQNVKLEETLSAIGVQSHLSDSIPNPNVGNGTYFKHQSTNIAYDLKTKNIEGLVSTVKTVDIQSILENVTQNSYITINANPNSPYASSYPQITGTLQQLLQAIVNCDPSIYDIFVSSVIPG